MIREKIEKYCLGVNSDGNLLSKNNEKGRKVNSNVQVYLRYLIPECGFNFAVKKLVNGS